MQSVDTDAQFVYNENGLRVKKTVNGVVTDYTLHGKNVVHMTSGTEELHIFYDAQNRPAVVVYNGVPYAYVKSLQGDIAAILDENGNTVVSYGYDAWGAPLWCTGELAETLGKVQPFRYRGYVFDEETGLYYLRSRYYNPQWGRFVNADTRLSTKGYLSYALFAYCKNSPIFRIDSSGKESYTLFPSEFEGVSDFAQTYNDCENEVATVLYQYNDMFFYGSISVGSTTESTLPAVETLYDGNAIPIAPIHTHTNNLETEMAYIPSEADVFIVCRGKFTRGYLVTPDYSILRIERGSESETLTETPTPEERVEALRQAIVVPLCGPVYDEIGENGQDYITYTLTSSEVYQRKKKRWWFW